MGTRKRIYVAGPYSDDNVIGILKNMKKGMRVSTQVLIAGFAPFCPWHDYHFTFQTIGDEDVTIQDYYDYSMAWLEVSDAILILPDSENSKGTQAEIARAKELNIPIFYWLESEKVMLFDNMKFLLKNRK